MRKKCLVFFRFGITAILNVCAFAVIGTVQAQSVTDGSTPPGIAPGSPAGSYALSDLDTVNLFNGHLDVRLDLLNVAGRGGAGMTVGVSLNPEPWVVKGTGVTHDWWSLRPGYGPGVMQVRRIGVPFSGVGQMCSQDNLFHYRWTRTAVTFKASDGTEFELWDKQSGGPWIDAGTNFCSTGFSRGTEFVTADGTSATFVSDSVITDRNRFFNNTEQIVFPTGNLILKNGTRYRIVNGLVDSIRDRNGNLITFTYGLNSSDPLTYRKVLTITDSLNRVVSFQYTANFDVISFKGFNGAARTITINRNSLSNLLRADFVSLGVKKPSELFPGITPVVNEQVYNPSVIASITLPNGRNYLVQYNQYAEVARVVMPTGGAIEYDMVSGSGLVSDESSGQIAYQIYRRVWKRRTYANETDVLPVQLMIYNASGPSGDVNVTVDQLDPQNSDQLLTREKHYFHGNPVDSLFRQPPSEGSWGEGREYRTEYFSVSNGVLGNVIRKVENLWEPGVPIAPGGRLCKARVKETTVTLLDTNQVSKQVFGYDDSVPFNNQNNVKEYDFGPGAPGVLLRETRTTYVTSTNYTGSNVNLVGLPSQISVFDGNSVERARTSFEYDIYTLDGPNCLQSYHCGIRPRSNISGFDPAFGTNYNTRGNVTASTQFLLTNGFVTGSITSYSHYDIAGNVVRVIDPRSTPSNIIGTTIEYDDRFGAPNGEARANSAPTELVGQSTFAFPSRVVNPLGHESYTQRNYYLGQAVDVEDSNGTVSSSYFNDSLDRPTQVITAVNGSSSVKSQTTFAYDDAAHLITTTSDQETYADNILKSQLLYDGLGRTFETRQYEGGANYIAVQTQYDALGRAYKVSNPFRPLQSEAAAWTITGFDAMGRVMSVTTPDTAVVKTAYDGNRVLVADQNSSDQLRRKRISVTDGLGRLKEVWEVTTADPATESITFTGYPDVAAGYVTRYEYDTLDNLTSVSQRHGSSGTNQVRSFKYDSLKRLMSATNPESGRIDYQYDNYGNLLVKTDARTDPNAPNKKVSTHFEYDALNRVTRRWYNGSSSLTETTHNSPTLPQGVGATDEVKFYYDSQPLSGAPPGYDRGSAIGRLVAQIYGSGSNGDYYTYDVLGRQTVKFQQIGSKNYKLTAGYTLSGTVSSLTYPSNHTIANSYDQAGRLTAFSGNLGDGVPRTYSTGIVYSPFSSMLKEQFGTNTPVYHKLRYNSRAQICDVRASAVNDEWGGELGALAFYYHTPVSPCGDGPNNNGNLVMSQTIINSVYFEDRYTYDSLNRLTSVSEYQNETTPIGTQEYDYDRWGNRTIKDTSSAIFNKKQFTVNPANNRLGVPGGQPGVMEYDAAGNLTNDTYTGAGNRTYDAENKMTSAWGGNNQAQTYKYDGAGQRIKRTVDGVETWQVYGFGGELIAEYPVNGDPSSPQKEYGYRNGQLLITAVAPTGTRTNVALSANGGVATASSSYSGSYAASGANDGDRKGLNWGSGGGWNDATLGIFPDSLQIDFNGSKTIDEIDVFTIQDNFQNPSEPTEAMTFSLYGLTEFHLQYWNESSWIDVPEGHITGNNKVWKKVTFAPITTNKIQILTNAAADGYSRIIEVEAWSTMGATNLALNRTATQSSTALGALAGRAVDGNTNGNFSDASVTHTVNEPQPWWQVDLGTTQAVQTVELWNRTDCCSERLSNFNVSLLDANQSVVATVNHPGQAQTQTLISIIGNARYVKVQLTGTGESMLSLAEVKVWSSPPSLAQVNWLVSDQLGTPRMIIDQTGTLANVKRHDYLPFGEELFAGTGGRTSQLGYSGGDGVRQQFTSYERDLESGLDFAGARFSSSVQGRFTSVDPLMASAVTANPQTLNRYSYVTNSPLTLIDPTGMFGISPGGSRLGGIGGLQSFSLNMEEPERQQTRPQPVATQTASLPNVPMCGELVPVTVIVTQMEAPDFGVANVNGRDSLVVGVLLQFTFLDQNGKPINAAVGEVVTDSINPRVITSDEPTFLDSQGRGSDLVSNSYGSIPIRGNETSERAALNYFNADFTSNQTLTLSAVTPGGAVVRVTQQRTLTNTIPGAPSLAGGLMRGYTFTMGKPRIERIR